MKHEILTYLINHKENSNEGFTQFLRRTFPDKTRRLVKDTLQEMWTDGTIAGPANSLTAIFMPGEDLVKTMADFPEEITGWKITTAGERHYFDDEFRGQVMRLNAISIQANKSSIETNKSIRSLNRFQKWVAFITLLVAVVSCVAIFSSAKYAKAGVTSADVKAMTEQMKTNTAILDSLSRHAKAIDSTLQKIARDTIQRKSR